MSEVRAPYSFPHLLETLLKIIDDLHFRGKGNGLLHSLMSRVDSAPYKKIDISRFFE